MISLIQQLGFELHEETDLKLAWLRDALFSLPASESEISHLVPKVLNFLSRNLDEFIQRFSNEKDTVLAGQARRCRLLSQIINSLID
jgi:hypothetical protein